MSLEGECIMVKWMSDERRQEKRIRYSQEMVKRKTSDQCIACKTEINPGNKCFFFTIEVKGLQYPVRRYVCIKCHDEVMAKPEPVETVWPASSDF